MGVEIVIEVDDANSEHEQFGKQGENIADDMKLQQWGLWSSRIKDTNRHELRICERGGHDGLGRMKANGMPLSSRRRLKVRSEKVYNVD